MALRKEKFSGVTKVLDDIIDFIDHNSTTDKFDKLNFVLSQVSNEK